jgi:hypothetical protein
MHQTFDATAGRRRVLCRRWRWLLAISLMLCAQPLLAQGPCEASAYGMRADGSDNTAALTRVLSECAGRTIHIAHGTYTFMPRGFAPGMTVASGTSIIGDGSQGEQQTVLQIADTGNFMAFLWMRNVSDVSVRQLRFEGTSFESGCPDHHYGGALVVLSDPGQTSGVDRIDISDNVFHNFNGEYWIAVSAEDGSPGIGLNGPITISGNVFVSDAGLRGGCAATGGLGYPVAMVSLHGSNLSAQGLVADVAITSNTFLAGYVKDAVAIWSGTLRTAVRSNVILDAGLMLPVVPNTDLGRYAILIYNSAHRGPLVLPGLRPDEVSIVDNTITNPYSCGIYSAAAQTIEIVGNRISGQRDSYDDTLPKGAIVVNRTAKVRALKDNELTDNRIAISVVGPPIDIDQNKITVPPGGLRARLSP